MEPDGRKQWDGFNLYPSGIVWIFPVSHDINDAEVMRDAAVQTEIRFMNILEAEVEASECADAKRMLGDLFK